MVSDNVTQGLAPPPPSMGPGSARDMSSSNDNRHDDLIFPPADLRGVIEKTAQFVAKNGVEFEERVMRERDNVRFSFLLPDNPYNAYYRLKVREFKTGEQAPKPQIPKAIQDMRKREEETLEKEQKVLMLTEVGEEEIRKKLTPPVPDMYTISQPYLAPIDVDIIQATAQFVARNGQRFLAGLAQRETNNPQFDFLKPSHPLFTYFTNLVDAYSRCLLPPKGHLEKLKQIADSPQYALQLVLQRFLWEAEQERQRKEKEDKTAEERATMMNLEWHNFHIAETIDFTEEDEQLPLAAPIDFKRIVREAPKALVADGPDEEDAPDETIAELIEEVDDGGDDEMEFDEDMDSEELKKAALPAASAKVPEARLEKREESKAAHSSEQPGSAPLKIVKGYVRQRKRAVAGVDKIQGMQKCPITGQLIPAADMSNHLRILLLDPKWKEQKERFLEKARAESAFAPMEDVEGNLALFVTKRPDLFGSVDEEVREQDEADITGARSGDRVPYDPTETSDQSQDRKRPRTGEGSESFLLTILCEAGVGLEAQEIQVEVDEGITAAALKESLIEAGLGTEALQVNTLVLFDASTGVHLEDSMTLAQMDVRNSGSSVVLRVV